MQGVPPEIMSQVLAGGSGIPAPVQGGAAPAAASPSPQGGMSPDQAMMVLEQAGITPDIAMALNQPEVQEALMTMMQSMGGGAGAGAPPAGV